MKKNALLLIFLFTIYGLQAQKIDISRVPSAITKDFNIKFPSVSKVKWERTETLFFARFMIYGKGVDVTYELDGNWVETMTEISLKDLPAEVITGISNIFDNTAKIKTAAKIETATNEILYVVRLRYNGKNKEVTLNEKGSIV